MYVQLVPNYKWFNCYFKLYSVAENNKNTQRNKIISMQGTGMLTQIYI